MAKYQAFSQRTLGTSHKKDNLPCQDSVRSYYNDVMAISVVADGHGSPQYFRSNLGSDFAAQAALDGIKSFIEQALQDEQALRGLLRITNQERKILFEKLIKSVYSSWYEAVFNDEQSNPLKLDMHIENLQDKYRESYLNDVSHQNFTHAYGTTLIATAITENFWFGFHIGDGKCGVLFEDGTWDMPIPPDDNCFLNSTTSICDDNAAYEFRLWYGLKMPDGSVSDYRYGVNGQGKDKIIESSTKPLAVFIGSDGVDDSFPIGDNDIFLEKQIYRPVILTFAKDGFERTEAQILELIDNLAEKGSRDDVSLAGIIKIPLPPTIMQKLEYNDKVDRAQAKLTENKKFADQRRRELLQAQDNYERAEKRRLDLIENQKHYEAQHNTLENDIQRVKIDLYETNKDVTALKNVLKEAEEQNKHAEENLAQQEQILGSLGLINEENTNNEIVYEAQKEETHKASKLDFPSTLHKKQKFQPFDPVQISENPEIKGRKLSSDSREEY